MSDTTEKTADKRTGPKPAKRNVSYSMSNGLVPFLKRSGIAIAATSYQSGRLYLLSANPKGGLMVNEEYFQKAMRLFVDDDSLLLASLSNIYRLENVLRPGQWIDETYTHCYVPRTTHFTGSIDAHDVAVTSNGQIVFVNTRYNCLATLSEKHSFRPIWRPNFISSLVDEDRCHLNGFTLNNGELGFATAVSKSDTIDGWRERRRDGGIVIDVQRNEIICEGLSMPHSPRMHQGKLWIANSGSGEVGWIEMPEKKRKPGRFRPLTFCPGFVRGLAFHNDKLIVGLSKPRYERFEGLELDSRLQEADSEPWCGIQAIDTNTGECKHWFRIDGDVAELYDVAIVPNVGCAKSLHSVQGPAMGLITIEE